MDVRHVSLHPRSRTIALAVAALLAFALLSAIVLRWGASGPTGVDAAWAEAMRAARSPLGVSIALAFNTVGGTVVSGIILPIAGTVLLICVRRRWAAIYLMTAILASALTVQLVKLAVARPRPTDRLVPSDFGSFPSGHSANAAVIVTVLVLLFPRQRCLPYVGGGYVLLMMLSRTYLSVHWMTDTIAAALLGFAMALFAWACFARRVRAEQHTRERATLTQGFAASVTEHTR